MFGRLQRIRAALEVIREDCRGFTLDNAEVFKQLSAKHDNQKVTLPNMMNTVDKDWLPAIEMVIEELNDSD